MKGSLRIVSAAATLVCVMATTAAGAGSSYPRTVGRDLAGDWGSGSPSSNAGAVSGEDLLRASLAREADTLEFILDVAATPPAPPQTAFAVYEWYFTVDGRPYGIYGPCQGHIYGDCETAIDPMSFVVSDFDGGHDFMGIARLDEYEDVGQVIFPIPLDFLGAHSGSVIAPSPAGNMNTEAAVVAHTFYFVNNPTDGSDATPRDFMTVKRAYKIP
jgi:hypothetical protein